MNAEAAVVPQRTSLPTLPSQIVDLFVARSPKEVIERATELATILMQVVEEKQLYQKIRKKKHIQIEGWQMLGMFCGVVGRPTNITPVIDGEGELAHVTGFDATADAVQVSTGKILSSATMRCSREEENWNLRPEYEYIDGERIKTGESYVPLFQLQSMAQTRAISKALRNVLGWIVVLAGYQPTPAEEMGKATPPQERSMPKLKAEAASGKPRISDAQRKRLWAIIYSKEVNCPKEEVSRILGVNGFAQSAEITVDVYDSVVEQIRNWNKKTPSREPGEEG